MRNSGSSKFDIPRTILLTFASPTPSLPLLFSPLSLSPSVFSPTTCYYSPFLPPPTGHSSLRRGADYPSGYTSLEDHALIGNMRTAALVSISGTIASMCLPHFDSPSVFARILEYAFKLFFSRTRSFSLTLAYLSDLIARIMAVTSLFERQTGQIANSPTFHRVMCSSPNSSQQRVLDRSKVSEI